MTNVREQTSWLYLLAAVIALGSCSSTTDNQRNQVDGAFGDAGTVPSGTGGSLGGTDTSISGDRGSRENACSGDMGEMVDTALVPDVHATPDLQPSDDLDPADVAITLDSTAAEDSNAQAEAGEAGGLLGEAGTGTGCPCVVGSSTAWDCFCRLHVFDCSVTLDQYDQDGGSSSDSYSLLLEYDNCSLVVVSNSHSGGIGTSPIGNATFVFDKNTGALIGQEVYLGFHTTHMCMSLGEIYASGVKMIAGRFPDTTCVVSKCVVGAGSTSSCLPTDGGT